MKTAITTTQILKHAKKVDAAAFDKWLTKNDVNYDWLDITLTDMNDGWYNIVLEDDTNICFVDGKYIADQSQHDMYIHVMITIEQYIDVYGKFELQYNNRKYHTIKI